ncbi:MAG: zinc ribbon domain-containing protein [Candidatus Lokiarchaeota archaeon]|nr:zinc ribbon domain-containing protein [Candidatus Lokiarchaeota archaeon]
MGKMICKYEILNHKENFYPNDEIEGIFYIENQEEKDKKLKSVGVQLIDSVDKYVTTIDHVTGNETSEWKTFQKTKEKLQLAKGDLIRSGETKQYQFKVNMPKKWKVMSGGKFKNWHLALIFKYKSGIISSQGDNKFNSTYVIPVQGSQLPSHASSIKKEENSEDMKFCSECGKKIKRTSKFCEHCGAQF